MQNYQSRQRQHAKRKRQAVLPVTSVFRVKSGSNLLVCFGTETFSVF